MSSDSSITQSATRHPPSAIFLVGFMASGKSTVGPLLAAELGRPFIDLDQWIENQAQCTIFDLVRQEGEARFRQLETQMLQAAVQTGAAVIAPGGGAITRPENRALMQNSGVTIWLDTPFDLCWQRIQQDGATRPLAADKMTAQTRYEQRLPLYQQAAVRIRINEELTAAELAAACLQQLNEVWATNVPPQPQG